MEVVKKRNYGIDLLRIISMLYVVILHCISKGGILSSSIASSPQYMVATFIDTWAVCAVNIFAIISGFVGFSDKEKKIKLSSYFMMWAQVVTYGVIVTLIFKNIYPNAVYFDDMLDMFFPVSKSLYWYFTAYTALFFIMPLLNSAIRNLSEKQLKINLLIIFIIFVCYNCLVQKFWFSNGYSFIWLIILYLIGAIMKKCDIGKNIKISYALIGIVVLTFISWAWRIYGVEFEIFRNVVNKNFLISYTSPTIVIISMLYIIGFSKMNFPRVIEKIIKFCAPAAFAVYILNNQKFIWEYVINNSFASLATEPVSKLIFVVMVFSILFVIISILIDRLRIWVFKYFELDLIFDKISNFIEKILCKLLG